MPREKAFIGSLVVVVVASLGSCTALLGLDREFGDGQGGGAMSSSGGSPSGGGGGGGDARDGGGSSPDVGATQWVVALSSPGAMAPGVGGVAVAGDQSVWITG